MKHLKLSSLNCRSAGADIVFINEGEKKEKEKGKN